jgi:hypothetical protein
VQPIAVLAKRFSHIHLDLVGPLPVAADGSNSNGNDIETKAERSFDLDFVFEIEAKRTCLFKNL